MTKEQLDRAKVLERTIWDFERAIKEVEEGHYQIYGENSKGDYSGVIIGNTHNEKPYMEEFTPRLKALLEEMVKEKQKEFEEL